MDCKRRRVICVSLADGKGDGGVWVGALECLVLDYGPVVVVELADSGHFVPANSSYQLLCRAIDALCCQYGAHVIMIAHDVLTSNTINQEGEGRNHTVIEQLTELFWWTRVQVIHVPLSADKDAKETLMCCC